MDGEAEINTGDEQNDSTHSTLKGNADSLENTLGDSEVSIFVLKQIYRLSCRSLVLW